MTLQQKYETLLRVRMNLSDTQKLLEFLEQPSAVKHLELLIEEVGETLNEMEDV